IDASLVVGRKGASWRLMIIESGLPDKAAALSLQHLFELYMLGDPSPHGLRKALDRDPGLAKLLGPKVIAQLLAAAPMPLREGTMQCPGCRSDIAAHALRCGYCGL